MNVFILSGNFTRDPEAKYTTGSKRVCSFDIAHNGYNDTTLFMKCEAWEQTSRIITDYCKKGTNVTVQGRLELEQWEDRETGETRTKYKIVVSQIDLNSRTKEKEETQETKQEQVPAPQTDTPPAQTTQTQGAFDLNDDDLDEIPF